MPAAGAAHDGQRRQIVRCAVADCGTEDWLPYQRANFVTPSFPEYLSGHSTFSAAAAALLKAATGSDTFGMSVTITAGSSNIEPGAVPTSPVTLSWKSFYEAAD
jgi:hypothetical protein